MWKWSATTGGWYNVEYNTEIPEDAVDVTDELRTKIFEGVETGKQVVADKNGQPSLKTAQKPRTTKASIQAERQAAYRLESDPLKNEADFDAIKSGTAPDYTAWISKVKEIKERFPLPVVS